MKTIMEVSALSLQKRKDIPPEQIKCGDFLAGWGLKDDCRSNTGNRQVSFFSAEHRKKIEDLKVKGFCMIKYKENVTIKDLDFPIIKKGVFLKIGSSLHRVSDIGKKCFPDCPAFSKDQDCIMITGVFFTEVIQTGSACIGSTIKVSDYKL